MAACNTSITPVDTKPKVSASDGDPYPDPTHYRSLAGALQYLTFTRPDISYAVQQICLHMHDPRDIHMIALKRILRYIRGTVHYGISLTRSPVPIGVGALTCAAPRRVSMCILALIWSPSQASAYSLPLQC